MLGFFSPLILDSVEKISLFYEHTKLSIIREKALKGTSASCPEKNVKVAIHPK